MKVKNHALNFSIFKVIFGGMPRDTSNYDSVVKKNYNLLDI